MVVSWVRGVQTFLHIRRTYRNWFCVLLYRFGIVHSAILKVRDGARIRVRDRRAEPADAYVAHESWVYGIHDALLPYLENARVGIDLGAHIGTFAVWAALRSPAHIYAVEAADANLPLLRENILMNRLSGRVRVVAGAVARETGVRDLYITENSALISMRKEHHLERPDAGALRRVARVNAFSLKDIFLRERIEVCDFMKVDIEGGEHEVFMHLEDDIYARIRAIRMEISTHAEELAGHIRGKGFRVSRLPLPFEDEYLFVNLRLR